MKKIRLLLSAVIISVMVIIGMSITSFATPIGTGTNEDPFLVTSFTEGEYIEFETGAMFYWKNNTNHIIRYDYVNYYGLYIDEKDFSLSFLLEPGEIANRRLAVGVYGFNINKLNLSSDDPSPSPAPANEPIEPEQFHNNHAEKAQLVPVKNTDGSFSLNAFGVPVIVCSECGQVHNDFAVAHENWLDEVENAVKVHKNFGTDWKTTEEASENPVTITSTTFISFDKDMLSYLNSQPDAVILKFKYNGKYYVTTIPSDFDCLSLADENGWAGFAYIMSICGGREITEEEFIM